MLEDLNAIDWQNLTHGYGRANNIPNLVRQMMSSVSEVRQRAIGTVFESIWKQEILYEATPVVIPFLIELLENPTIHGKKQLLFFLADLAMRCAPDTPVLEEDDQDEDPWQMDDKYGQEWIQQQHTLCKNTYTRIAQGCKTYLNLLSNEDPEIRAFVPYFLDILEENTEEYISSVQLHLLEEKDPQVKTSILIYLDFQTEYSQRYEQILRTFANTDSENTLVKTFSSFYQAKNRKENPPQEAVRLLLEALTPSQELEEAYRALPWVARLGRSIISVISLSLPSLVHENADIFISKLLEALAHLDTNYPLHDSTYALAAFNIVRTLLNISFYGKGVEANKIPFLLTKTQRSVLVAITHQYVRHEYKSRYS